MEDVRFNKDISAKMPQTREEAIEVVKKHLYKCSFNLHHSSFTMLREALKTLIPELKENEDYMKINCIRINKT